MGGAARRYWPMSGIGPEPKWAQTVGMSAVEGKPENELRRLDRRF
jgi:hypothetical protein